MKGLFLHTSNRLELLAEALASVLRESPPASPLEPEVIMVQSQGMQRWLSLQLADRLGICMNFRFPFPRTFLGEVLAGTLPQPEGEVDPFSPEVLTWKIFARLPGLLERPEFAPVRAYLSDHDAVKQYQLCARLAGLFDQYLAYRPALLTGWETHLPPRPEPDELWQAVLWRTLNAEPAAHFGSALERLARGEATLPPGQRVAIFGISALPPAQVEVLFHLAATRPVHLFLLSPSSEYHGDDLTPRQRARRGLSPAKPDEAGNPLLTSLGRLNARFVETVLETDERAGHRLTDATEAFPEPPGRTLLERLQRDILRARQPLVPEPPESDDRSLSLHVCHSPMREVEVLYDQLLALMEADRTLQPRDVLVMSPEIEVYAPLIHAVFGAPEDPALQIPYSVADRQARSESRVTDTFLRLLELPDQRATAPEVLSLLESAPFRERFRFTDEEPARLRDWVEAAGIRWGLDEAHRAALRLPAYPEGTWRHGVDRLLLGFALPGENARTFEGILPFDDVEGSDAGLAGRLAEAVDGLIRTVHEFRQERTLGEWPAVLEAVIDRFFTTPDESESEAVRALRDAFGTHGTLAKVAALAGPETPVPFEALREAVAATLAESEPGRNRFLTGGVTFCALKPMRSIPARVIWLLGMNEGVFPRKVRTLPFDLMSRHPKPGDRSVREDDRYLFLETLLSARERLGISFLGRSLRDHAEIPPSIVISELLDAVVPYFPSRKAAMEHLLVEHRLQAFSPDYFGADPEGRRFSYSQANATAAAALATGPVPPGGPVHGPLPARPLPEPGPEERRLPLERLERFLTQPAAFFLEHRLGVDLRENDETVPESEPLAPDALQRYLIRSETVDDRIRRRRGGAEGGSDRGAATYGARALLPPGALGACYHVRLCREAEAFEARLQTFVEAPRQPPEPVTLTVGTFEVEGTPGPVYGDRQVFYRAARLKARDRLRAWVRHLFWNAAKGEGGGLTVLVGQDETVLLSPVDDAPARLEELLAVYRLGLTRPVPFFPETSLCYAEAVVYPSSRARRSPLDRARDRFAPSYLSEGAMPESLHPANVFCFGAVDPMDQWFEEIALKVWEPLLQHQEGTPVE